MTNAPMSQEEKKVSKIRESRYVIRKRALIFDPSKVLTDGHVTKRPSGRRIMCGESWRRALASLQWDCEADARDKGAEMPTAVHHRRAF